jgi:two-component system CheB/CheR fusion protein
MLLRESTPKGPAAPKLQVFATDIDERSLGVARAGRHPAAIARDVSQKRLREFFSREDGTYRISSELREIVLFSGHNDRSYALPGTFGHSLGSASLTKETLRWPKRANG